MKKKKALLTLFIFMITSVVFAKDTASETILSSPKFDAIYLDVSQLYLSEEGIQFESSSGVLMPLKSLHYSQVGYFTKDHLQETQKYRCYVCGSIFSYQPNECPICHSVGTVTPLTRCQC